MTRKKTKCHNESCNNLSFGFLCRPCDLERRKKPYTRQEYCREWNLNKKYGLDSSGFDVLWIAFRGKCGICDKILKMPEYKRGQSLDVAAIDHDHKTGNIRGLLCNSCNKGIGHFYDDVNILKNAINWLEKQK
jgi:hypothetical protein